MRALALVLLLLSGLATAARAQTLQEADTTQVADTTRAADPRAGDRLQPGAWEFGMGGSISNYSGTTYGSFEARAGTFAPAGQRGLVGFELLLGYGRQDDLNLGDALFSVSYEFPFFLDGLTRERGATWPYFGAIGGVSQAWADGYQDTRFPVGGFFGVRMMPNEHSAVRIEVRVVSDTGASTTSATRSGYFVVYSFRIVNPRPR